MVRYQIVVPDDLWHRFKATITLGEGTINDVIVKMIEERVEKFERSRRTSSSPQAPSF